MARRRPHLRWTAVLAVMLVATMASGGRPAFAQGMERAPLIGALPFTNGVVGDERAAMNPLSSGIPELLLRELARDRDVRTVEPERLHRVLVSQRLAPQARMDDETASHVGRILGAERVIRGVFTSDGRGSIRILTQVVDVSTARIEHEEAVEGKRANIGALIGRLASRLSRGLRLPDQLGERRNTRDSALRRASFETTLLFSRAIEARDGGHAEQAVALLQQLLAQAPEYDPAQQELARLRGDRAR
jgi:hypothetical protein